MCRFDCIYYGCCDKENDCMYCDLYLTCDNCSRYYCEEDVM